MAAVSDFNSGVNYQNSVHTNRSANRSSSEDHATFLRKIETRTPTLNCGIRLLMKWKRLKLLIQLIMNKLLNIVEGRDAEGLALAPILTMINFKILFNKLGK